MAISQNHVINIQPGVSAPLVIHCSQGDTGTQINLTVVNGDEEFDCSSYACSVHGVRSDGGNWGPITCTVSGSTVCFSLTSAMTAVAGSCLAEVSIGTVGTANFALLVENATFESGVTYSNDVSVYQNILTAVQTGISNETAERVAAVETEKNERVAADNSLSSRISQNDARINNLVGNTGNSNSEIVDARVGVDGSIYSNLGTAIRSQVGQLYGKGSISFEYGSYYATGLKNNDSVSVRTNLIVGAGIVSFASNAIGNVLLYKGDTYIGKVNAGGDVDKMAGSWYQFTGTVEIYSFLKKYDADGFALVVLPVSQSDSPTSTTYQKWADEHCTIYTGIPYALSDIYGSVDVLNKLPAAYAESSGLASCLYPTKWFNFLGLNPNTGLPSNDGSKFISDFIPAYPNSIVNIQIPSGYISAIYKYDANKAYIGRDKKAFVARENDFSMYMDCSYIRIAVVNESYITPIDFTVSERCKIYHVFNTNDKILSDLKNKIFSNTERINALEGGIPDYWSTHLQSQIDIINNRAKSLNDGDQYVFITDLHINEGNSGRYGELIDHILNNTSINKVICGGDLFTGNTSLTGRDAINLLRKSCMALSRNPLARYYYILGNHDRGVVYGTEDDESTNTISLYQLFRSCGMVNLQGTEFDTQSLFRYYFDDSTSKLRYIIATPTEPATESEKYSNSLNFNNAWVANSLMSLPADYDAVIMTHIIWNSKQTTYDYSSMLEWNRQICDIINAFNSRTSVTCNGAVYDFSGVTNGRVILYHGGHMHTDINYAYNGVNIVVTTCDSYKQQLPIGNSGRRLGDTTENAFDVVTIDKGNGKIFFDRIGFGESRSFDI